jgi:hypothetical protein
MTNKEVLRNWLTTGLRQSTQSISEFFYFDRRDNQFFSILVTDYFLFDDEWNIGKGVTSTYSKKSLDTLQDRVRRIVNNDLGIVAVPKLGNIDARDIQRQIELFLQSNSIALEEVTIWEPEDGDITINVTG